MRGEPCYRGVMGDVIGVEQRDEYVYPRARKAPALMPEMDSATARRLDAAAAV